MNDMDDKLREIRDWAQEKLASQQEPPWAWFQYMKLREVLDQILAGQAVTKPMDMKPRLRVVGDEENDESGEAAGDPTVQLPI